MWTGIIKAKKRGKEDNAEEEKQEDQHQQETLEEDFAEEGGEEETPKEKDEVVSPETLTTVKRPREGSAKKARAAKQNNQRKRVLFLQTLPNVSGSNSQFNLPITLRKKPYPK